MLTISRTPLKNFEDLFSNHLVNTFKIGASAPIKLNFQRLFTDTYVCHFTNTVALANEGKSQLWIRIFAFLKDYPKRKCESSICEVLNRLSG